MNLLTFKNTAEYPNTVTISASQIEVLKQRGWDVNMHTPGYANFIGATSGDIFMGFYCWDHDLGYSITGADDYNGDIHESDFKIKNQKDLNDFCAMIELLIKLKNV